MHKNLIIISLSRSILNVVVYSDCEFESSSFSSLLNLQQFIRTTRLFNFLYMY